jgi:hypothetical protein
MIRKLSLLLALPAFALAMACEGAVTFTWSASAEVDFGGSLDTSSGAGDGSSVNKQLEINIQINKGNGDIDTSSLEDDISLTQRWSTDTGQMNDTATLDGYINGGFDNSLTYRPIYAAVNATDDSLIDARFVVTLQYGWNCFEVMGTLIGRDAKGNEDPFEIDEPPTYIYGDFGDIIPLKVALEWNLTTQSFGSDLDLIINEVASDGDSNQWIYWDNMGYDVRRCYGSSAIIDCYQNEYYVVGEDRTSDYSFSSLDKDDIVRGGPEIATLDPQVGSGGTDPNPILPQTATDGYTIGDIFEVWVAYYEDDSAGQGSNGQEANGVVSVYLNGAETPFCYQTGLISEFKIEDTASDGIDDDFVAAAGGGNMYKIGELQVNDNGSGGRQFDWVEDGSIADATVNSGFCEEA